MWTVALAWAGALDALEPLGTERLEDVAEVRFTFEVSRGDAPGRGRTWAWRPADGTVTRTLDGGSLTFRAGAPASDAEKEADAQFVNDAFWLLPRLHMGWAASRLTVDDRGPSPVPVGEGTAHRIDVRFPSEGGYTPGDGYDLYVRDGRLVGWTYRAGGGEASLSTSFEGWVWRGPLAVATDHRTADGSLRVRFTDVDVALAPGLTTLHALTDGQEGPPLVWVRSGEGCRVGTLDVPERDGRSATDLPVQHEPFAGAAGARVRRGDRAVDVPLDPASLALDAELVGASGFARCDLRGLDGPALTGLLDAAGPQGRPVLLAFAVGAWLDDAPVGRDRILEAARGCASGGSCADIVGLLAR